MLISSQPNTCTQRCFELSFESALHCKALDARPSTYLNNLITVAILAQGTSWAVADTQAFLHSGSIPPTPKLVRQPELDVHLQPEVQNVSIPDLGLIWARFARKAVFCSFVLGSSRCEKGSSTASTIEKHSSSR